MEHVPACHSLRMENFEVKVRLGCLADERAVPQLIRISAEFVFEEPPKACLSDELEDTICYAQVCDALKKHCESREFKLIERIGFECYGLLRELSRGKAKVALKVHKVKPPVESLAGGSTYSCGDFKL